MPVNIYAENIDTHIRGRNYTYQPITYNEINVSTNTYYENIGVFHITFELDDEYIGYILPNYSIQYDNYFYGAQTPNWGTLSKTFDRRIFVNGSSFSFDVTVNWNSININTAPGGDPFNYDSYTITSSDVTKYADIDSLDQIINILQDLYNSNDQVEGLLNDQLTQLQLIVSNTSLANQYLDTISKLRQWNFPIESFNFVYMLMKNNVPVVDMFANNYYSYPVFEISQNTNLTNGVNITADKFILIFGFSRYLSKSTFSNYFTYSNDYELTDFIAITPNTRIQFYKAIFTKVNNQPFSLSYTNSLVSQIVPIYFKRGYDELYNSTDFALVWGLSNQLLDNIQLIANGTNASSAASSQSDQANSQLQQDSNTLFSQEDSFKQNMNSAMQNIDTTFTLNNFGQSFMTSAQWVRTQYERLTNNNPFASLITFSLLVGLALIVVGKVYK